MITRRNLVTGAAALAALAALPVEASEPRLWYRIQTAPGLFDMAFEHIWLHTVPASGRAEIITKDYPVRLWEWYPDTPEDAHGPWSDWQNLGQWVDQPAWTAYEVIIYGPEGITFDWQTARENHPIASWDDLVDFGWSDHPDIIRKVMKG